ncbi:putative ribonuclease H-like domain-containing protein, partial [Tanacetum coccineum]
STSQPPTLPLSMQITYVAKEAATMPHDSPLLKVYSLGSDEASMTLNELTVLCTTLSKKFYGMKGIKKEFSVARTPQQNGVAERKNRILIEALRTMLADSLLPTTFCAEAVNTACFMRPFVTILNTLDPLGKFDRKADEGEWSRMALCIDSLTKSMNYEPITSGNQTNGDAGIETNVNAGQAGQEKASDNECILLPLMLSNSPLSLSTQSIDDKDADEVPDKGDNDKEGYANSTNKDSTVSPSVSTARPKVGAEADLNNLETTMNVSPIPTTRIHNDHPIDQIIGDINLATQTRRMTKISKEHAMASYIKKQRRTNHKDYQNCLFACFLSQIEPKKVWTLVDLPKGKRAIGTKWVYRNKKDERGILVRNKARLVAQGYNQEEGIKYDKVFAPVARIEAIGLFLAYASFMRLIVYQMDVKSAFFIWGQIDKTLFIKRVNGDILLVQVYVDDIIFGSTRKSLCTDFEQIMHKRFQMSSMGELTFFLGLQVKQKDDGIFISQDKYVGEILKKFGFFSIRTASTPMETNKALAKYEEGEDVDVHLYRSMIGSLMYLTSSRPDIMFSCKKQTVMANSTTEAEYIATSQCCGQVLLLGQIKND